MRRNTFVTAAVALSLVAGGALAATGKIETAKKPPVTMQFEVAMKRLGGAQPSETVEKVFIKGDRVRVEGPGWPGGDAKTRSVSIYDGKSTVRWNSGQKTAFRFRMPFRMDRLSIKDWPNFKQRAKKVGSEKLNGMQCDVYLLPPRQRPTAPGQPRPPQGPRAAGGERGPTKIWVWTKYDLAIKQVTMGPDNKPMMVRESRNIVVGKPLADSLFQVPKSITVKDAPQGMRGFGRWPGGPQGPGGPR